MYIADYYNSRIRKVTVSTGIISTVAGTGTAGYTDNALATKAKLNYPTGVAFDSSGTNQNKYREHKIKGINFSR